MLKTIPKHIRDAISDKIISTKPITGGSISSAYLIETKAKCYFLKINRDANALEMFNAEQKGLEAIKATNTIAVPTIHLVSSHQDRAFLLMDFIESKLPEPEDYARLATDLAALHLTPTDNDFGFESDNFIGSLPQSNSSDFDWAQFYWNERISPQLQMAIKQNLLSKKELPPKEQTVALFNRLFEKRTAALIHGDLWGGNFLISSDSTPYLIDPAVYRGDPMVDIAMSRLFGNFDYQFYDSYHKIIAKSQHYEKEIDLYQLYFLLVHLNLFGKSYYSSVSSILNKYF